MSCGSRVRGETDWRCWQADCVTCAKTYRIVTSRIVAERLEEQPDLRQVYWLPVDKIAADQLSTIATNFRRSLEYHNSKPERYFWFVVETCYSVGRYMVASSAIDRDELDYQWTKYDGTRQPSLDERSAEEIRRDVATHCGMHDLGDAIEKRVGSSQGVGGLTPRRNSGGYETPPRNEIAYSQWTDDDGVLS